MKRMFILPLSLLLLPACHHTEETQTPHTEEARRTVLVYMAAQNSLGAPQYNQPSYAAADSAEIMEGRTYIAHTDRLLLFIDDGGSPRLYEVKARRAQPILLKHWKQDFCSTSPQRFEEVLKYTRKHFQAQEYGLVMWSHADGWIPPVNTDYPRYEAPAKGGAGTLSFGIDSGKNQPLSNRGANMSVEGMAQALKAAGIHCKYIFFDACLMQNLEVAYALRHVTDYLIGSPMSTPGAGSYYTHNLQSGFFTNNPADIARTYLKDVQSAELASHYDDFGLSISCIRTDRLQPLADILQQALPHSKLTERRSPDMVLHSGEGETTQIPVLHYQAYDENYFYRPHNYDARQALRCLLTPEWYELAQQALDEAVVFHGSTPRIWIGPGIWSYQEIPVEANDFRAVSLFVPHHIYTRFAPYTPHGDLNQSFKQTEWYCAAGFGSTGW